MKTVLFQAPAAIGISKQASQAVIQLQRYLRRFGYLRETAFEQDPYRFARSLAAPTCAFGVFDDATEHALKTYQKRHSLAVTGELDAATIEQMNRPRCGFPDNPQRTGVADFVIQGNHWNTDALTYRFQEFTADLAAGDTRAAVTQAFGLWSAVCPLRFTEVAGDADIVIRFVTGDHGDGSPFDGVGHVLAHGYYPPPNGGDLAGDVHFDDAETWTVTLPPTGVDLVSVAAHEIGHALGLDHSTVPDALMYAYYSGAHRYLHQDDVDGIQQIYPLPVHAADVRDATTPELDALHNNIQVATHRWARNQGYVAGVWNHEQSGNRRGVICFRAGSADVIDATTAELDALHTNIDVAAHRWARNRGYVAGIWNHEQSGNLRGIISVRSGSADVRDATTAELNALHADIDVAAHRWACASARYVAGIWNHEQSGDRRGVICVRR